MADLSEMPSWRECEFDGQIAALITDLGNLYLKLATGMENWMFNKLSKELVFPIAMTSYQPIWDIACLHKSHVMVTNLMLLSILSREIKFFIVHLTYQSSAIWRYLNWASLTGSSSCKW